MSQVPAKARVKGGQVEAVVLALTSSLPGVPTEGGSGYAVLLFPDGEVKYYVRTAIETTEWKPT